MKQRIAKEMPFVRIHYWFLSLPWLIIKHTVCDLKMQKCFWCDSKHQQPPNASQSQRKYSGYSLLNTAGEVEVTTASEIFHCCCSPSLFSMDTFCSANHLTLSVLQNTISFTISSTLLVCFVCMWHSLHHARSSTAGQAQILVSHFLLSLPTQIWYKTSHRHMHSSD